ncbi:MAG: hypothetical protein OCC49_13280 [Fibrobacterales bacterium]
MASFLSDLDELVLKCRDEKAKKYINEAILCYKAGAFRSAIVSTWIAVVFDLIEKLKELSLAEDPEGIVQYQKFEDAKDTGDISKSLELERNILTIAKDKLELISSIEFIDLDRIFQDRHRCAHPSMNIDGEIFNPPAELARVHILTAINTLLRYPPAQGKNALNILIKEVESEYFPTKLEKAVVALTHSPFNNARISLVRNFIIILLKKILFEEVDYKLTLRCMYALEAIEVLRKDVYDKTFDQNISTLIKKLDDISFHKATELICSISNFWLFLDDDVKQKYQQFTRTMPSKDLDELYDLIDVAELQESAKFRIARITKSEFLNHNMFFIPSEWCDRLIELLEMTKSFKEVDEYYPIIKTFYSDFDKGQVEKIVQVFSENGQIRENYKLEGFIAAISQNEKISAVEFNDLLDKYDFGKFKKVV